MNLLVVLAVLLPAVCALGIFLFGKNNIAVRHTLALAAAVLTAVIILTMNITGDYTETNIITIAPGLTLSLKPDPFGMLFATLSSVLWIFSTVYSFGYMAHEHNKNRFFAFFTLCLPVVMGIALSANLFTFYLFYELLTLCTYPLVIHEQTCEAIEAGRKYLVYSFGGASLVLLSMIVTYNIAGTLEFKAGGLFTAETPQLLLNLLFAAFFIGFGVKSAVMPLHAWLPAAMVAPTPVSALLHAVAVVKSGVFAVIRLIYFVFGPGLCFELGIERLVPWVTAFTIIAASLIALRQDNLKRRLAYSTISQLGYILFGVSLLSAYGFQGGLVHILNHAVLKITLFFCAGYLLVNAKISNVSEMKGIGYRMPVTMLSFSIAALGMVGMPLTNGFVSKWFLAIGALEGGKPVFVGMLLLSSLLNAAYFLPIVVTSFFPGKVKEYEPIRKNMLMQVPIVILAATSLVFGIFPQIPFSLVRPVYALFFG